MPSVSEQYGDGVCTGLSDAFEVRVCRFDIRALKDIGMRGREEWVEENKKK